jgi:hypothetical protein
MFFTAILPHTAPQAISFVDSGFRLSLKTAPALLVSPPSMAVTPEHAK